jgi:hypothetical protein
VVFIESRIFTRELRRAAKQEADAVLNAIQNELLENPACGDVVPGLGGIRKARALNPFTGKGKRGGFRYLFLYLGHKSHIHLLYLYGKGQQIDLSNDEKLALRALVSQIKQG